MRWDEKWTNKNMPQNRIGSLQICVILCWHVGFQLFQINPLPMFIHQLTKTNHGFGAYRKHVCTRANTQNQKIHRFYFGQSGQQQIDKVNISHIGIVQSEHTAQYISLLFSTYDMPWSRWKHIDWWWNDYYWTADICMYIDTLNAINCRNEIDTTTSCMIHIIFFSPWNAYVSAKVPKHVCSSPWTVQQPYYVK